MERVDGSIQIVYHDLHNITFVYHESINSSVYFRISVRAPSGECSVQGWYFLSNIRDVVEKCSSVVAQLVDILSIVWGDLPRYSVGIKSEIEVQGDGFVNHSWLSKECLIV